MPVSTNYQTLEVEQHGELLVIKQNRPDKLNCRNSQMYVELMAALATASSDASVALVVLTGVGKFFSAGMDFANDPAIAYTVQSWDDATTVRIKENLPERQPDDVTTWLPVKFIEAFINFDKPLVGAVNGPAIGEGFTSLLHCDVIYCSETAYFWGPFARAGVAPEFCSTQLLEARLGKSLAAATMYLARRISAQEAKNVGFVVDILPASATFLTDVVELLQEGLALTGPPELRASTLSGFKHLANSNLAKQNLIAQCHAEFNLIRERAVSGETKAVQTYYQSELPS
ncbi:MAG: hypothetical protein GKR90_12480 [Pseudomonadales bacterium]|nr:hypothetical protein [Pseudomonadales bacterium]